MPGVCLEVVAKGARRSNGGQSERVVIDRMAGAREALPTAKIAVGSVVSA